MESKLGQHFEFEPFPYVKIGENGSIGYSIEHKVAVEFLKSTEQFLLGYDYTCPLHQTIMEAAHIT
jgi:hypothetical protein